MPGPVVLPCIKERKRVKSARFHYLSDDLRIRNLAPNWASWWGHNKNGKPFAMLSAAPNRLYHDLRVRGERALRARSRRTFQPRPAWWPTWPGRCPMGLRLARRPFSIGQSPSNIKVITLSARPYRRRNLDGGAGGRTREMRNVDSFLVSRRFRGNHGRRGAWRPAV